MTSTTLTRDRNYYRMCDNDDLIHAARDSRDELALALAERLEETAHLADSYDGATSELAEALRTIDHVRDEVQDMLDEIERLRALVAEM
jgi:chromosome segregation ATPase